MGPHRSGNLKGCAPVAVCSLSPLHLLPVKKSMLLSVHQDIQISTSSTAIGQFQPFYGLAAGPQIGEGEDECCSASRFTCPCNTRLIGLDVEMASDVYMRRIRLICGGHRLARGVDGGWRHPFTGDLYIVDTDVASYIYQIHPSSCPSHEKLLANLTADVGLEILSQWNQGPEYLHGRR